MVENAILKVDDSLEVWLKGIIKNSYIKSEVVHKIWQDEQGKTYCDDDIWRRTALSNELKGIIKNSYIKSEVVGETHSCNEINHSTLLTGKNPRSSYVENLPFNQ